MEDLRTFIAVDIPVDKSIERQWELLKNILRYDKIKWVDNRTLHLTLFFLGNTSKDQVDLISKKLMESISGIPSFSINVKGLGSFGNPSAPKVMWIGVERSDELVFLKNKVTEILLTLGFGEEEKIFTPHITLGRVKEMKPSLALKRFIDERKNLLFEKVQIKEVVFYQSILRAEGPIYKPIATIKLLSL